MAASAPEGFALATDIRVMSSEATIGVTEVRRGLIAEIIGRFERKGFTLTAEFYFIDGKTGATLHKEKFSEEVLYAEDQRISPLSSYFELMDRLLPNFLGVLTPQRIRGTRVLLR